MAINDYTAIDYNASLIIENQKLRDELADLKRTNETIKRNLNDYRKSALSIFKVLKERLKNDVPVEMQ